MTWENIEHICETLPLKSKVYVKGVDKNGENITKYEIVSATADPQKKRLTIFVENP